MRRGGCEAEDHVEVLEEEGAGPRAGMSAARGGGGGVSARKRGAERNG